MYPFFILGCVRSGTTLLRDLLKQHPNLVCPEETHIFRWGEPFANTDFNHVYKTAETLIKHRNIDHVDVGMFNEILLNSKDRGDFFNNYIKAFKKNNNYNNQRAFDKTPQNIYGLPLIKSYFPNSKLIQLIRNPLNVVASLKQGLQLAPQSILGGINYWKESILIMEVMKPLWNEDVLQIKYEDLTSDPKTQLDSILDFINEDALPNINEIVSVVRPAIDSYKNILTNQEIELVKHELQDEMQHWGY